MRIKTNIEREARKQRNKAKRKNIKKDVFKAIRGIVNEQKKLDNLAKEAGITEEEMEALKESCPE